MSDPRFARLKTDPRFRPIRKRDSKLVVDDRFKSLLGGKKKRAKKAGRVDKYGRQVAEDQAEGDLRRFYRLEDDDVERDEASAPKIVDYARGQVLLESSDEEDSEVQGEQDDSDDDGIVTLGRDASKPIPIPEDNFEINLDEEDLAELDAQAVAYAKANPEPESPAQIERTNRIAVVNLDWDHVRAIHLFKIFSSLVSPSAPPAASSSRTPGTSTSASTVKGKVLNVRVYPSQFGKERIATEDEEGPPPELFKKNHIENEEDINEKTIYETGDGEDYDEDALRNYQLERLRYYYAIAECDTVEAASHIYSELEGTEFERSANVFDLSFVPNDMTFDDQPRDVATDDLNIPYKPLEFVTDALRHSRVKLTWDDDDPERIQLTRKTLSQKEVEQNDFKAYLASSDSESEDERDTEKMSRDKLRALLLGGGDDVLPEGWGNGKKGFAAEDGDDEGDVDMEITFTPGLSEANAGKGDETTLEVYQRKMKEKRKKRKEELKQDKGNEKVVEQDDDIAKDDFFAAGSDDDGTEQDVPAKKVGKKARSSEDKKRDTSPDLSPQRPSTTEELELLAAPENPDDERDHFDMKAVVKAEKTKGKRRKGRKNKGDEEENELQEDFVIDVKDDRFNAIHEDHSFAIDPSNPHFKKTKSMSALLGERAKRQRSKHSSNLPQDRTSSTASDATHPDEPRDGLKKLVESVKRKSQSGGNPMGKRRKL